jgi:hypothetical protein
VPFRIDGREFTYDVGVPDAQGGELPKNSTGTPPVSVEDTTGKDLSRPTRLTLSQYLSDLTTGKQGSAGRANRYPVDRDATYPPESSIEDGNYPASLDDAQNSARFAPRRHAEGLSTRGPDAERLTSMGFRAGARPDSKVDGHGLLRAPEKVFEGYTSHVLLRNRFTPFSREVEQALEQAGGPVERPLRLPGGAEVSPGRLATLGTTLTLRAAQELTAGDPGNDPNSALTSAGALAPSPTQLGVVRVRTAVLSAQDVLGTLTQEASSATLNVADESWGSLNSVADPFSGIASVGMYGLALALGAGVVLLVEGLNTLLSSGKNPPRAAAHDALGRYAPGSYTLEPRTNPGAFPPVPFDLGALFGIRGTVYPFVRALKVGTAAFFGVDDSSVGAAVASGVKAALGSPGFYVGVARTILRSGVLLVDQLKRIGGNPVDVVKQVIGLVDVIRGSRLISALNVFAQLGDQLLSTDDRLLDARTGHPARLSTVDSYTDDSTTAVMKSRLKESLKLAWASNRTPTVLLMPKGLDGSLLRGGSLGAFDGGRDRFEGRSKNEHRVLSSAEQRAGGPMVPVEEALELERRLEAEYVPFYFKDLRTREVLSFHAFLASLSDGFTAAWEDSEGYGRIEPVGVYKNTRRKIGLSFYVASTSPADFDEMWVKINKLVTLVYPQYTAGKQLTVGDPSNPSYRFTQPFSQLVGASPLVRLRLGDLLRSNYSRFALARLFGLGGDGLRLDSTDVASRDRPAAFREKLAVAKRNPSYAMRLKPGLYLLSDDGGRGGLPGADGPKNAPVLDLTSMSEMFEASYLTEHSAFDGRVIVKVKIAEAVRLRQPRAYEYVKDMHDNEGRPALRYVDGEYVVPLDALEPTPETAAKILAELDPGAADDQGPAKLADFMSPTKNALVRSFRSTAGKGLAGRIDSLEFDWYDKATWDTSPGRTAPIMCKVTMQFTPIHDISPGLDHMGFDRGPIYPVGTFMRHAEDDTDGRTRG